MRDPKFDPKGRPNPCEQWDEVEVPVPKGWDPKWGDRPPSVSYTVPAKFGPAPKWEEVSLPNYKKRKGRIPEHLKVCPDDPWPGATAEERNILDMERVIDLPPLTPGPMLSLEPWPHIKGACPFDIEKFLFGP